MDNPYAAPTSEVSAGVPARGVRARPLLVWVITLIFGGSSFLSCISLSMPILGWQIQDPVSREFYAAFGLVDWVVAFSAPVATVAAAVSLFLMKKAALRLWLVASVVSALSLGYNVSNNDLLPNLGADAWLVLGLSFGMLVVIVLYVWHLYRRRALQG
ncbi:MAG: hypothetical protein K0S46_1882 [Moraxellaceae bacterium]|nr:hypothetical protein [Moraxellaceae bacterium]